MQGLIRNCTFTHIPQLLIVQSITLLFAEITYTYYKPMTCSAWSETRLSPTYNTWFLYRASQSLVAKIIYVLFINRWHAVPDQKLDFHPRTTSDLCTEHHNYSLRKLNTWDIYDRWHAVSDQKLCFPFLSRTALDLWTEYHSGSL